MTTKERDFEFARARRSLEESMAAKEADAFGFASAHRSPEKSMAAKERDFEFASASLPQHLVRGVLGFGALVGGIALIPVVGLVSLALLPVGLLALRGCPMCWTVGLIQTISRGRLQRSCVDGQCGLTVASHDT